MTPVLWQYRYRYQLPNGGHCDWHNCRDEAEANEKRRHHEYEVRELAVIPPAEPPELRDDSSSHAADAFAYAMQGRQDEIREWRLNEAAKRMVAGLDSRAQAFLRERGWAPPERAKALSEAAVTLQREVDRLRLALAEEIAGRLDRALSPNNAAGPSVYVSPGVYVGRVITAEELSERVMAAANRKVGFGPWAEDKL